MFKSRMPNSSYYVYCFNVQIYRSFEFVSVCVCVVLKRGMRRGYTDNASHHSLVLLRLNNYFINLLDKSIRVEITYYINKEKIRNFRKFVLILRA